MQTLEKGKGMAEEEQYPTKLLNKAKGIIAILVTLFVGFLLIWGSYIYQDGEMTLRVFPDSQIRPKQKVLNVKKHLIRACDLMKKKNLTLTERPFTIKEGEWLISESFRLIACKVRKVGSTNTARVFYTLDHMSETTDSNHISKGRARHKAFMEKKNKTEVSLESQFKSYKKFMFVRDPLERLLSAYRDYRPPAWFKPNGISFKDYLANIIAIPDRKINFHMISYTTMCNPCEIEYDFIGLMDTYERDMRKILDSVGIDKGVVVLPKRNQTGYKQNKSDEVLETYLKDVPMSLRKKMYNRYYWDYFLFGFTKPF